MCAPRVQHIVLGLFLGLCSSLSPSSSLSVTFDLSLSLTLSPSLFLSVSATFDLSLLLCPFPLSLFQSASFSICLCLTGLETWRQVGHAQSTCGSFPYVTFRTWSEHAAEHIPRSRSLAARHRASARTPAVCSARARPQDSACRAGRAMAHSRLSTLLTTQGVSSPFASSTDGRRARPQPGRAADLACIPRDSARS